jgi:hypothetical protein
MSDPRGLENGMRAGVLVALLAVIVVAPLVGTFVFSPFLVAWGLQPYPLAAAVSVMIAEALAVIVLAYLVARSKR